MITTGNDLVRLVVEGAAPTSGVVYDPCAGEGNLLVACTRAILQSTDASPRDLRIFAQEIDSDASRVLRSRLLCEGVTPNVGQPERSSIGEDQFPAMRANLVVADPPVSPKSPLATWVDHAMDHLNERGRAVIVIPAHALTEVRPIRRLPESDLVERLTLAAAEGRIMSVTVGPTRLRRDVHGPLTVWVLRHDAHAGRRIAVTTTDGDTSEGRLDNQLAPDDLFDWLASAINSDSSSVDDAPSPQLTSMSPSEHGVTDQLPLAFADLARDLRPLLDRLQPEDRTDGKVVRDKLDQIERLLRRRR